MNTILCQTNPSFFADMTFWTVVISAVAVILSQLPPIWKWFKKAKIELDIYPTVLINHKVGNPIVNAHIKLTNVGGSEVKINKFLIRLYKNDSFVVDLACRTYRELKSENDRDLLFTPFRLKIKDEWSGLLNFYNPFGREDEKKYRELESKIKEDIFEKRKLLDDEKQIVDADDKNVQPFKDFMDKKFIWKHGDYKVELNVETNPEKSKIQKNYRFILYESDQEFLENYKEEFKTGAGIYYDSANQPGLNIEINDNK